MRIMRSRQPALPAPPHPLMRVAAATSASPRRPGCTRLYFPHSSSSGAQIDAGAVLAEGDGVAVVGELGDGEQVGGAPAFGSV